MAWFVLWLKKIILLVLLAAFLDLILPNTSLQRYVKMVMGLLILLTIITPIFSLFHISPDELAVRFGRYQQELEQNRPYPIWQRISQKLVETQDRQAERYVSTQMAALIREQIGTAFGVTVASVDVRFHESAAASPEIETITLVVTEREEDKAEPSAVKKGEVRPIQPVDIEVQVGKPVSPGEQESIPASSRHDALRKAIAAQVARDWQIAPEQVKVFRAHDQER